MENPRHELWVALSTLFLDTEPDASSYRYIARVARDQGFTTVEVKNILENEVAPACAINLFQVAGEWDYFDRKWLFSRIQQKKFNVESRFFSVRKWTYSLPYRSYLREQWQEIEKHLLSHQ